MWPVDESLADVVGYQEWCEGFGRLAHLTLPDVKFHWLAEN
jgi:hypothetical protein